MFKYTDEEKQINKVLKMNQDKSIELLKSNSHKTTRLNASLSIESSEILLRSLGYGDKVDIYKQEIIQISSNHKLENRPVLSEWQEILKQAELHSVADIELEDLLTKTEINNAFQELNEINRKFSEKTGLINKVDLSFLSIATTLQVLKTLVFPYIAKNFNYGDNFDPNLRMKHDDKSIKAEERKAKDLFRNKKLIQNKKGHWVNILYQGVPYDAIKGSKNLNLGLSGTNHRLHTLGHDPILGWIFGTANILTDVITMNDFTSYRVSRKPTEITSEKINILELFFESYEVIKADYLNLPAAIVAQAQHYKSDVFTKQGLPVPILTTINENFASRLYKQNYDALCLERDCKITSVSYAISTIIDLIITLVHGIFRKEDESKELYEVRTEKLLLISNSIATSSSVILSYMKKDLKTFDIGSLISTLSHLFRSGEFILKVKKEFIEKEIDKKLQKELEKIDTIYKNL